MAAYSTVGIARAWAQAVAASAALNAWAQEMYKKHWRIAIGTDMRRSPSGADAPFCVFFPDTLSAPDNTANQHSVGLIIGVDDSEFVAVNGIDEMRGLTRLDGLWPSLRAVLDMAIPGAMVTGYDVDYIIQSYPLVMLSVTATVEQKKPVGSRY